MSVAASASAATAVPLLFGERSPSPSPSPSLASPHPTHTPVASPPHNGDDMSSLLHSGQGHDRDEDAPMPDSDGPLPDGHDVAPAITTPTITTNTTNTQEPAPGGVAVEVAAVDEDAMDTTPDSSHDAVQHSASADPQEAAAPASTHGSPAPEGEDANGVAQGEATSDDEDELMPPLPPLTVPGQAGIPPPGAPPPLDPTTQPPPPPPEPIRSDSDSSDEDDGQPAWHPIAEDTSVPDADELKEIEALGEHSAFDHEYWQKKAFVPLVDPEYKPGVSGRFDWTVDHYNGTRETPNKELVMRSPPATIGGHQWQIKFFPKGNDTDFLSVYIQCLSVVDSVPPQEETPATKEGDHVPTDEGNTLTSNTSQGTASSADAMATDESNASTASSTTTEKSPSTEFLHAPLPLLNSKLLPKRKSVAAQISVVVYNPSEPRVAYSRESLHRFCALSSDWGWTQYHAPYFDISRRSRGQRQALLRGDKLAFTCHIRIIEDETGCLYEHPSRDNPWDSFAMTGLQSLRFDHERGPERSPSGGNLISAIASWMLFKPFRKLLYSLNVPDPDELRTRTKPLLEALVKTLYMQRTFVESGEGPVSLESILEGLEWYGMHDQINKLDVIEVWEVLRLKLEDELRDTPHAGILDDLFGIKKDYSTGRPSYRVPVVGMSSMQEAINNSQSFLRPSQPLPQLLTVELDRQEFDVATHSYVKLLNKVTLDDTITVQGTSYTLLGFVVHKQTLQSYLYQPVLRPEGPGSKWYTYTDRKEENIVKCLTKREALGQHQGKSGPGKITGNDEVAYIALYVREDVTQSAFTVDADSEQWDVPRWVVDAVSPPSLPPSPTPAPAKSTLGELVVPPMHVNQEFHVIDSRAFLQHEGPGVFDAYDLKWRPDRSDLVHSVRLEGTDFISDIRDKLALKLPNIQDPRQIKFWSLDPVRGMFARPAFIGTGQIEYSSGSTDRYRKPAETWELQYEPEFCGSYLIWAHVVDIDDLPPLPPPEPIPEAEIFDPEPAFSGNAVQAAALNTVSISEPGLEPHSEDTPMSDSDEPMTPPPPELEEVDIVEIIAPTLLPVDSIPPPPEAQPPMAQSPDVHSDSAQPEVTETNQDQGDTAMAEVEVDVTVLPTEDLEEVFVPFVGEVIPLSAVTADTEMVDSPDNVPPPPPPVFSGSGIELPPMPEGEMPPPPPPPVEPPVTRDAPPEEIYFFLKFFNAEKQTLESRGSHIALKSAKVNVTVLPKLNLPADAKVELLEEDDDLRGLRPLRSHRSFITNDLRNTAIIIAYIPPSEEQRAALAAQALFSNVAAYLSFREKSRNNPASLNGHFTYNYFSSQFYKGEFKNGLRHGHGKLIYHSGATYEGDFQLGQRHGHGVYTFQNGDIYDGDWVANQQHGTGTFVEAATGNLYLGGWKNDKKFGEGVTHWKNAQETERMCRICWDEAADAAFYDCGHVVACLGCARQVQTCPVCRKRVVNSMKLYYVA